MSSELQSPSCSIKKGTKACPLVRQPELVAAHAHTHRLAGNRRECRLMIHSKIAQAIGEAYSFCWLGGTSIPDSTASFSPHFIPKTGHATFQPAYTGSCGQIQLALVSKPGVMSFRASMRIGSASFYQPYPVSAEHWSRGIAALAASALDGLMRAAGVRMLSFG